MSYYDPEFTSGDIKFDRGEAARFQEEVVIPAVDRKWGGEFLITATPGSRLEQIIPVYADSNDVMCQLECGNELVAVEDEEEESGLYIQLAIHIRNDELLEGMKKSYMADKISAEQGNSKARRRLAKHLKAELQPEGHSAWEITTYIFYPGNPEGFEVIKSMELRDGDNDSVWNTRFTTLAPDIDGDFDIDELNKSLSQTLTSEDYFIINDALLALGAIIRPETLD